MFQRHKYTDDISKLNKLENPVASKKYDGACFFMSIGEGGVPSFISRRESVKGGFPDKTDRLPHLATIKLPDYEGMVIHTELIHTGKHKDNQEQHPVVSGILNSLPQRAKEQQELHGPVRAVMFDIIHPHINTYGEKIDILKKIEAAAQKPDLLFVPEIKIGKEAIEQFSKTTQHHGDEGIVITDLRKPESENIRIKVKHFKTANLRIKGLTQEFDIAGNPKESTGAFVVEDSTGKEVANVGTGIDRETRIQSWRNKNAWIGRIIQVKYMEVAARRLRHPVYNGEADGSVDKI